MKDLWKILKLIGNILLFIGLFAGAFIFPYRIVTESTIDNTAKLFLMLCVWCSIHYMMENVSKSIERLLKDD